MFEVMRFMLNKSQSIS